MPSLGFNYRGKQGWMTPAFTGLIAILGMPRFIVMLFQQ
jgi:hypothetical protein